ncbi:unnamed protein product [Ambrosiozyma monospora]|uniref:Unnamed protein product n=1 Tax=Ambrosiozyma monospora TaxID=43982 RepID=A0ACB5SX12_AMBMO|nr:unnamed protein product [Ambrosiozyma monospora]
MYLIHKRLIRILKKSFDVDPDTLHKLKANASFDLLITLPPILGVILGMVNGCSTRNACIAHTMITRKLLERAQRELDDEKKRQALKLKMKRLSIQSDSDFDCDHDVTNFRASDETYLNPIDEVHEEYLDYMNYL